MEGDNTGSGVSRNIAPLLISDDEFKAYIDRHVASKPVVESSTIMRNSCKSDGAWNKRNCPYAQVK